MIDEMITVTRDELIELFTEWRRAYNEHPELFEDPATPEQFGVVAADHFLKMKGEHDAES